MLPQNSEIRKYGWQSFTLQRVIAMPAVILAILSLLLLGDNPNRAQLISMFASQGFYIIVFLWGGYQAANALVQEVKENTWDNLRLSSVSPWSLTLGKLLGSTLYTWYGGIIVLAVYLAFTASSEPQETVFHKALVMVGSGILCQAVALLSSMVPLRMQASREQFHVAGYFILGLMVSGWFLSFGLNVPATQLQWWTIPIDSNHFFLASLAAALLWSVWAIYRFMRETLKFKNTPFVWGGFVLFCMAYFGGFANDSLLAERGGLDTLKPIIPNGPFCTAFFVGLACTFFCFFAENLNIIRYRALFHHWKMRASHKLLQLLPLWAVSFTLAAMAGLALILVSTPDRYETVHVANLVLGCLLFLLRDACIFHYFTLAPHGRLPLLAAVFYLGILYLLVPGIVFATGIKLHEAGFIFYPAVPITGSTQYGTHTSAVKPYALIPVIIELGIAFWLLKRRYQQINRQFEQ